MTLMTDKESFAKLGLNEAINAHSAWLGKLKDVLDGTSTEPIDSFVVIQDNHCALGKWIHGPAKRLHSHLPEWDSLRVAHANFHQCIGKVLEAHRSGDIATAVTLLNGPMVQAAQKNKEALMNLHVLVAQSTRLSRALRFNAGSVKQFMVWYTLAILTGIIFVGESLVQFITPELPAFPLWYQILLNASFISVVTFPVIYFQVLRPLMVSISARKLAEASFQVSAVAFESNISMMVLDANEIVLKVNRAYTETSGYIADEIIGRNPRVVETNQQDAKFYAEVRAHVKRTGAWHGEVLSRRKNGQIYLCQMNITAVYGDDGTITNYVIAFTDLTEQKATEKEINDLVFYDVLTGLPNRRMLMDRLQHAIALNGRNRTQDALLYIDLDNFKMLNDTLGQGKGDLLLQQAAARLSACVRECDTAARIGGDEFVVILEGLKNSPREAAAEAEGIARKILASLNRTYQLAEHDFDCSASIGIAMFSDRPEAVDDLLKRADLAMYQAKVSGRNTLRFFDPEMQTVANSRAALEADLRRAIVENQLELYFQAQVNQDKKIIGAEALIRWNHPSRGLISPADFIALAEDIGLILPIGQWVLEAACVQLKVWETNIHAKHIQLAVNVSPLQFRQADFVDQVTDVLSRNKIQASQLKIELTESMMFDNIDDTIIKMQKLKKVGVRFSMDDFGTGYSSLSYLTRLPLDQLKIDQSFVRNIGVHNNDAVIVQTIIGMTHNLGMTVIAEGVETEAQRAFLEQNGCLNFQGYLFSRPISADDFDKLLAR